MVKYIGFYVSTGPFNYGLPWQIRERTATATAFHNFEIYTWYMLEGWSIHFPISHCWYGLAHVAWWEPGISLHGLAHACFLASLGCSCIYVAFIMYTWYYIILTCHNLWHTFYFAHALICQGQCLQISSPNSQWSTRYDSMIDCALHGWASSYT